MERIQCGASIRVDNSDTTLEAAVEVSLASATSKHLSLHDQVILLCPLLLAFNQNSTRSPYSIASRQPPPPLASSRTAQAERQLRTINHPSKCLSHHQFDPAMHTDLSRSADRYSWILRFRRCCCASAVLIGVSCYRGQRAPQANLDKLWEERCCVQRRRAGPKPAACSG